MTAYQWMQLLGKPTGLGHQATLKTKARLQRVACCPQQQSKILNSGLSFRSV